MSAITKFVRSLLAPITGSWHVLQSSIRLLHHEGGRKAKVYLRCLLCTLPLPNDTLLTVPHAPDCLNSTLQHFPAGTRV
jgi:hypothetical protein